MELDVDCGRVYQVGRLVELGEGGRTETWSDFIYFVTAVTGRCVGEGEQLNVVITGVVLLYADKVKLYTDLKVTYR